MSRKPCLFPDCDTTSNAGGMCGRHYSAVKRGALKMPESQRQPVSVGRWQERAACRGMDGEIWFPVGERADSPEVARARTICARCPVVLQCAEWALNAAPSDGIFGGLTSADRRRIRDAAKVAALPQTQDAGAR